MTIAIIATSGISLTNFRGPLIKKWIAKGHKVLAISIEQSSDMESEMSKLGAEYIQVKGSRTGVGIFEGLKMIHKYRKVFRKQKPDCVYLYMSKPVAFAGPAAVSCGVKHINVLVNGLENAYYRTGFKDWIVRIIMSSAYRFVGNRSDNVFVQNSHDYEFFKKTLLSKNASLSVVNGSGVDMDYFKVSALPKETVFLMCARLLWSKGIREYLKAIPIVKQKCPEAKFMLVGGLDKNDEALSKDELERAVSLYDIEYIGYASDVRPMIEQCSIFVLPSYHEGLPRSILEAMSMGRPIITSDAPGCIDTTLDGINGFVVPIGNSDTLAQRMIQLANNYDLRVKMGKESHRICLERFDVNKVNDYICRKMGI